MDFRGPEANKDSHDGLGVCWRGGFACGEEPCQSGVARDSRGEVPRHTRWYPVDFNSYVLFACVCRMCNVFSQAPVVD